VGREIETRRATVADVDEMLASVRAGIDSFADFAPAGWRRNPVPDERERALELLEQPTTWALMALAGGSVAGHVAFTQATERHAGEQAGSFRDRPVVPGLAHLWQLFVRREWWGTGIAAELHTAAVAEMRAREYDEARLFTPAGHARARRFYERRGWRAVDERFHADLALDLTEYRLTL
jgi:ribosomal protein S18 acetylase RimI-like enzyme